MSDPGEIVVENVKVSGHKKFNINAAVFCSYMGMEMPMSELKNKKAIQ